MIFLIVLAVLLAVYRPVGASSCRFLISAFNENGAY